MDQTEHKHEERLNNHGRTFEYVVKKHCDAAKKCHVIFVENVKKVKDSVNLNVVELN